jgi:hypothetical protein
MQIYAKCIYKKNKNISMFMCVCLLKREDGESFTSYICMHTSISSAYATKEIFKQYIRMYLISFTVFSRFSIFFLLLFLFKKKKLQNRLVAEKFAVDDRRLSFLNQSKGSNFSPFRS